MRTHYILAEVVMLLKRLGCCGMYVCADWTSPSLDDLSTALCPLSQSIAGNLFSNRHGMETACTCDGRSITSYACYDTAQLRVLHDCAMLVNEKGHVYT